MLNLSDYPLNIGIAEKEAAEWFYPVLDRGRGAAFIDTGFLRGLFFDNDPYATTARSYFASASGNFYTTNLVLAETVRQTQKLKEPMFERKQSCLASALIYSSIRIPSMFVPHPEA